MCSHFNEWLSCSQCRKGQNMYTAYSDGASRGNPGPSSCSYVIYDHNNQEIDSSFRYLGERTNNYAEYNGLIDALWALSALGITVAKIFCDSKLVVNQVNEKWKVKHADMLPLFHLAQGLFIRGGHTLTHIDGHRGIQGNERADQLCNECLDGVN